MTFNQYTLEQACIKITDGSHFSPPDDLNSNIPMLSVKDMMEYDFDYTNCKHVSGEIFEQLKRNDCVPQAGDVLVAKDGSYLKEIFVNRSTTDKAILSSIAIFRPDPQIILSDYLCYLLKSPLILHYAKENCVSGSALPRIILKAFKGIKLNIPDLDTQRKIVRVLSAFDKKIELNSRQNSLLLDILKTSYRIALDNSKDLNEVALQDVFNFQEGPGIRNWQYVTKDGTKFINIRCIKDDDLDLSTANMISNEEAYGKYSHFMLNEDDVVVSTSGTLGRSQIIRSDHLPLCLNTSVIRFWPKDSQYYSYMYCYLISKEFLHNLDIMATGSAQRNFGPMHLKQITLRVPGKNDVEQFEKTNRPIINKICLNRSQNNTCKKMRDTLLPKLVTGAIDLEGVKL